MVSDDPGRRKLIREIVHHLNGHWSREVEALREITRKGRHFAVLLCRLHSFTNDHQIKQMRQLDCLRHDGTASGALHELGNEALVDLDDIYGNLHQIAQGRVPGTKGIKSQKYSERFE